ncbi:DUF3108 domain-containing protein [soil metagenome]
MKSCYPALYVSLILSVFMLFGFVPADKPLRTVKNQSFRTGETLKYKIHYGFITAAEGIIDIDHNLHRVNNRPCYRVNVLGKTVGSFDYFLRIRDTFRSYIDTTAIVPQRFQQSKEEGRYRKKETIDFDHILNTATVNNNNSHKVPENIQDIVSGMFYLRTLNLDSYRQGDLIKVKGFFDEEVYELTVIYMGKEIADTKVGKIRAHRLVPKLPNNKLFRGENAISLYLSDDKNKVPVLGKAEMFVGSVHLDLYEYTGLRHKLNTVQK